MKAALRQAWFGLALAAMLIAVASITYIVAERIALRSLREATAHHMELYAANLGNEMRRFEYLPGVLSADPRVLSLLGNPGDTDLPQVVNEYLQRGDEGSGASAIYVMDADGLTLAASNWDQPMSFVHMNFSYRPYFQEALKGRDGRFYGIGTVSHEPGYYFSTGVRKHAAVVGVVAVKVNLERLDQAWAHTGERVVVSDSNGIVFLSSEPQWKYKTLHKLPRETVGRLAITRQYSEAGTLAPIGLREVQSEADGSSIVEVSTGSTFDRTLGGTRFVVESRGLGDTDWRMLVMADMAPVQATARSSATLSALTLGLLTLILFYAKQRRRIVAQGLAASQALKHAYDELEEKVHVRTADLSEANRRLQSEIAERARAEESLRAALHDLVHTAKMAVLGQMSAGITHELNQPLAAVQTLSDNTVTLLDRGRQEEAKENLRMIAKTTAHMGKITAQLKKFARRSEVESHPVQISTVVADAIFLLMQGQRARNIRLETRPAQQKILAFCEANRLEQVIVNLLTNAVDAVEHVTEGAIEVVLGKQDDLAYIEVHDNGDGLSDRAIVHLFEPFFTTKQQGNGLGLGLAISNDIVRRFGGTLTAGKSPRLGGAVFIVKLRAAALDEVAYA